MPNKINAPVYKRKRTTTQFKHIKRINNYDTYIKKLNLPIRQRCDEHETIFLEHDVINFASSAKHKPINTVVNYAMSTLTTYLHGFHKPT